MAAWLPESVVVHCKGGTVRARISRRLAEGTSLGMALEALTAANLACLQPAEPAQAAM